MPPCCHLGASAQDSAGRQGVPRTREPAAVIRTHGVNDDSGIPTRGTAVRAGLAFEVWTGVERDVRLPHTAIANMTRGQELPTNAGAGIVFKVLEIRHCEVLSSWFLKIEIVGVLVDGVSGIDAFLRPLSRFQDCFLYPDNVPPTAGESCPTPVAGGQAPAVDELSSYTIFFFREQATPLRPGHGAVSAALPQQPTHGGGSRFPLMKT